MEALPPLPPFTIESAAQKVRMAEDAWNSRDPGRVVQVYTEDTHWRNRVEFPVGREEVRRFLERKWNQEIEYRLAIEQGKRYAPYSRSTADPSGSREHLASAAAACWPPH